MPMIVLLLGGGDLASGVAFRLHRAGLRLIITELPQPLVVRRLVSFGDAVYQGHASVEGITARRTVDLHDGLEIMGRGEIPVLLDPQAEALAGLRALLPAPTPIVLVDGRMTKQTPKTSINDADLVVGLGPGFIAGQNCHAVVETNRGHELGRVIWQGAPESDTGVPERVDDHGAERILRAPDDGVLQTFARIGGRLEQGQLVAEVAGKPVVAPFRGVLRGLLHSGLPVTRGLKIGDVDPRNDLRFCSLVSDKSLAIGGAVLEVILSREELRPHLWE